MNAPCLAPDAHRLTGELTIQFAAEQRTGLLALLEDTAEALHLDLAAVEACDSAGVQLLLATRRSLHDRGHVLHLCALSTPVRQVLDTYGLQALYAPAALAQASESDE